MRGLRGKVAIVTGATKPGAIGEAIAMRLAEEGARVIATGRNAEAGEAIVARIRDTGGEARFVAADVTREADVQQLVLAASGAFGGLDIVVNNAAALEIVRAGDERPVIDEPTETFDRMMKVGVYGPFWLAKHALPMMIDRGGGAFVNISSGASTKPVPGMTGYGVSKAALEALTRQIALDYGQHGIRANAILLGFIRTPYNAVLLDTAPEAFRALRMLTRVGVPDDIASMVAFLASDESAYVTGTVIPVDGGGVVKQASPAVGGIYAEANAGRSTR